MTRHPAPFSRLRLAAAIGLIASGSACWAVPGNATSSVPKMADPSQLQGVRGGEAARPAVGVPLMQAEELIKAGHFGEALVKVREAEKAAADMTPYERYSVSRTKAAAAMGAGQTAAAFDATEAAIATEQLKGDEQAELIASLVHATYTAKDYARTVKWADRYLKEGGQRSDIATLRMQAMYLGGDFAGAAAALQAQMQADDGAGRITSERELQLLLNAQRKLKNDAGAVQTVERLATRYPKPAYWAELLGRVDRAALSDRLFLDLLRLTRATGNLVAADETLALAQLALAAGFGGEAVMVVDEASAKGLFKDAHLATAKTVREKARRLAAEDSANRKRDEAAARASKDGNSLSVLGQSAAAEGQWASGITLMEQAIAKGGIRRVEELQLRLGEAQALAGQKQAATQTLSSVKGAQGLGELARLWSLYANTTPPQVAQTLK